MTDLQQIQLNSNEPLILIGVPKVLLIWSKIFQIFRFKWANVFCVLFTNASPSLKSIDRKVSVHFLGKLIFWPSFGLILVFGKHSKIEAKRPQFSENKLI